MSEAREGYLPVQGAQLYFREIGGGPPLLVLHGGPDFNHSYLLPDLDCLSGSFRLIYYDQRGRGRSSGAVVPEDVSLASEMDDLDSVRRHFGLDAVSLLGHSWGGLLAMEYATRHPERVSRMILLNTGPASHADMAQVQEQRRTAEPEVLARMRAVAGRREYAEGDIATEAEYYRAHFGATLPRVENLEAIVRRLRSHFRPADTLKARAIEKRLYAESWQSPDYDLLPRLRQLSVPTLVIHGERDLFPLDGIRKIAETLPEARLLVLKGCGHFAYLERPTDVQGAIAAFFSRR